MSDNPEALPAAWRVWITDDVALGEVIPAHWSYSTVRLGADYEPVTVAKLVEIANVAERAALAQQAATPKPLDDPRLQELFSNAIDGALTLGYQNSSPPPEGHWLTRFWNIGRQAATPAPAGSETSDAEMMLRKIVYRHRKGQPLVLDEEWPAVESIATRNATPLRTAPPATPAAPQEEA